MNYPTEDPAELIYQTSATDNTGDCPGSLFDFEILDVFEDFVKVGSTKVDSGWSVKLISYSAIKEITWVGLTG